ncbi:hypothetical protein JAAARDRAFT_49588 [Jaapia argillacea MUCL 33604]|uniref:Uncharacterized protein n=1 Tax=Jaapia argillacea MUCL 33604 TaxID=933084 RepID=A0A067PJJ5_9AGAM|nr:hypothetical protein JAAARDRAFT_49588 [Jaapia argillacea MUCL 33604]
MLSNPSPHKHLSTLPSLWKKTHLFSVPLDKAGHLVSITVTFTPALKLLAMGRDAKTSTKKAKEKTTKSDHIVINGTECPQLVQACLTVQDLNEQYSPGKTFGPAFKMWWSGSSGGKTGATMIENDHDFNVALAAILKKKKDAYLKTGLPFVNHNSQDQEDELLYGTKVPHLDTFSKDDQLHGTIIMQLKSKWPCQKHQGEHGEPGYCYVDATDFLKLKGIDLTNSETALMELELTLDIVADVPVAHLCKVMGAVEGCVQKFQVFCKEWNSRLEEKKHCL